MKLFSTTLIALLVFHTSVAQVEETETETKTEEAETEHVPDTTRVNTGNKEILIIEHKGKKEILILEKEKEEEANEFEEDFTEDDVEIESCGKRKSEAHWAGLDFGFMMLTDGNFGTSFDDYPYWENDAARSQVWNLNLIEHKFNIGREYFGLTTGLGFNWTSVGFKDNYVLSDTPDTLVATIDSVYSYSKNKLRATYLTVPLMLEFNTSANASRSFYLAAGVVGGVRLGSKVKRKGDFEGKEFTQKDKGTYGLNPFKLDAAVRLGYSDWGVFANYSLLPLFDEGKTTAVYPLTFGLSLNF